MQDSLQRNERGLKGMLKRDEGVRPEIPVEGEKPGSAVTRRASGQRHHTRIWRKDSPHYFISAMTAFVNCSVVAVPPTSFVVLLPSRYTLSRALRMRRDASISFR